MGLWALDGSVQWNPPGCWGSSRSALAGSKWRKQSLTDQISICSEAGACQGCVICSDCIQNIQLYCRNRIKLFSRHTFETLVALHIFSFKTVWVFSPFYDSCMRIAAVFQFFCFLFYLRFCAVFKKRGRRRCEKANHHYLETFSCHCICKGGLFPEMLHFAAIAVKLHQSGLLLTAALCSSWKS